MGVTEQPTVCVDQSAEEIARKNATGPGGNVAGSGIGGKVMPEDIRSFKAVAADCEKVIDRADSYIVLGRDRPGSLDPSQDGYGNKGHCGSHMIDMVVGRHACLKHKGNGKLPCYEFNSKGEITKHIPAEPDFINDAARIYISQKCNIDNYFGLAGPDAVGGSAIGFSGIGIHADEIRVMARHGVRITTGFREYNSQGAPNARKGSGTALIHGNVADGFGYTLQPMVLGQNLALALDEIIDTVASNTSMIAAVHNIVSALLASYQVHFHPPGSPSAGACVAGVLGTVMVTAELASKVPASMANGAMWKANRLAPFGAGGILSDHHFLN